MNRFNDVIAIALHFDLSHKVHLLDHLLRSHDNFIVRPVTASSFCRTKCFRRLRSGRKLVYFTKSIFQITYFAHMTILLCVLLLHRRFVEQNAFLRFLPATSSIYFYIEFTKLTVQKKEN